MKLGLIDFSNLVVPKGGRAKARPYAFLALPVCAFLILLSPGLSHGLSITGISVAGETTISNQTLSPNGATVQFNIDGPADITVTFYRVADDGSLSEVDTVTSNCAGPGACNNKQVFWDALWFIGADQGRYNGNYKFEITATTTSATATPVISPTVITLDSVDIHSLTVTPGIDASGNSTPPFDITYKLAKQALVTMRVIDSSNTVVLTILNNQLESGETDTSQTSSSHAHRWDGVDTNGQPLPLGVYTLDITAKNTNTSDTATRRSRTMTLASLSGVPIDAAKLFEDSNFVYPNPIRAGVGTFQLQAIRNNATIKIKIYTINGDLVRSESFSGLNSGVKQNFAWDTTNQAGRKVGRGLYLCVIREESSEGALQTVKKVAVIQ